MILYHGTSFERWEIIQKEGLLRGSHLTNDPEVADFFADDVVLRMNVPKKWVVPGTYDDRFVTKGPIPASSIEFYRERGG